MSQVKETLSKPLTSSSLQTGMLLILDPDNCPLPDGCGPRYSLLDNDMKPTIALKGNVLNEHSGMVISAEGKLKALPEELRDKPGYEGIESILQIKRYHLKTSIPFSSFLVDQASRWSKEKLGCELLWDKSFSWQAGENRSRLIVRMTDTFHGSEPMPYIELHFDGNRGTFIEQQSELGGIVPCS